MSVTLGNGQTVDKAMQSKEVKDFFQKINQIKKGSNETIEAPEDIYYLVLDFVSMYSKIYPLLEPLFPIKPGRIIIGSDVTAAEFKQDGGTATLEDFVTNVEFDYENGFKAIKVIFIDNSFLNDQQEEFEVYITARLAKSIALALDNAILNGQGEASYQMEGIIKNIPAENKVAITPTSLTDIVKPINLLDSGEYNDNPIVAIVNRNTYYNTLLDYLLTCSNPGALPKFIFCYAMAENQILYADFSKYILLQRGNFVFEKSRNSRLPFDETGYKGKMNFDGKPARPQAFSLVTLQ